MSTATNGGRHFFGTDGVRGLAGREPVTAETFHRLAFEVGHRLAASRRAGDARNGELSGPIDERPRAIVGRDTRISGSMLSAACCAGFAAAGVDVLDAGVIPTPAVAYLVRKLGCVGGAVLSASHNPFDDNGIKFFRGDGRKLSDEHERTLEAALEKPVDDGIRARSGDVGRIETLDDAREQYVEHALSTYGDGPTLEGLSIVVDCANGAASMTTPEALRRLGAKLTVIHDGPDGININAGCGSTHLESLREAVLGSEARCGLAHDGDADRVLMVDERGDFVDGDMMMALCGRALKEAGDLHGNVVVATVMSNLGLEVALRDAGIELVRTPVGDRYVKEEMLRRSAVIGGEQSGHVIFAHHARGGDGLVTALQVLALFARTGGAFSELFGTFRRFPQVLQNVRVKEKKPLSELPAATAAIRAAEERLGERGRVLVRYSGTEPLIRVMVEGDDENEIRTCADTIAGVFSDEEGDGDGISL